MFNSDEIIKQEIEAVIADIKEVYNASGKRVSGKFENDLEARYSTNKAEIYGHTYLAGRKAGKMPPIQNILEWVQDRGITPIESYMSQNSLAWAIAKKIAREGTAPENHLKIYEAVLTPQRIQSIIDKVAKFNVNLFVDQVTVELKLLVKNI